ncbi:MAG: universal stress protein [Candidatus Acidiferrales bacterium]
MKILLAVDGSEFSRAAMQIVASQFRPESVEVLVLRVVEPRIFPISPELAPGYAPELDEIRKEDLRQAQESVNQTSYALRSAGFRVSTRVAEDEARDGILTISSEWGADLIVLGSHGRKGVQRFLLGSVAEFVARHADCSVEIVRVPRKPGAA